MGKQKFGIRHLRPELRKELARQLQNVRGSMVSTSDRTALTLENAGRSMSGLMKTSTEPFKPAGFIKK